MTIEHTIKQILVDKFHVDGARVQPSASLQDLGLDSLGLMEFVFALEDSFQVLIPEERVASAGERMTLEDLSALIREHLDKRTAYRSANPRADRGD